MATPEYLEHYRQILRDKGPGFEATGWRNPDFQRERFRVSLEMQDCAGRVVLDAGAGRADFAAYMLEQGVEYKRFIALDAMEEMTRLVRERNLPRVEPVTLDFAGEADAFEQFRGAEAVFFGGSLNTFEQEHALRVLDRAWAIEPEALVFNFLTARCPTPRHADAGPANRFDPLAMLDWALERTHLVRFRQDYLAGHDATIAMRRA